MQRGSMKKFASVKTKQTGANVAPVFCVPFAQAAANTFRSTHTFVFVHPGNRCEPRLTLGAAGIRLFGSSFKFVDFR